MLAVKEAVGSSALVGAPPVAAGAPNWTDGSWAGDNVSPQRYFTAEMEAIRRLEASSGKQIVDFLPIHDYDIHDGTNVTNTVGGGGARGQLGWGPSTGSWYEDNASQILGRNLSALSTEGGASPDGFRSNDPARVAREMQDTLNQLIANGRSTANLWVLYESTTNSNEWNRNVFTDGEGAWGQGLDAYRRAYQAAQ